MKHYGGLEELKKLEINGKLNYIPQYTAKSPDGATYRMDLAEKWGIDVTDYDSLKSYVYKARDEFKRPMMYSSNVAGWIMQNFAALTGTDTSAGLSDLPISSLHDDPFKAVFVYELLEYKKALTEAKAWYDDGITDPDVLNTTADAGVMLQDGLIPVHLANHIDSARMNFVPQAVLKLNGGEAGDPDAKNPKNIHFGFMPYYPKNMMMFDQNMGNTTGIAINASVSDATAEAIIRFVEAAHTDKTFFDKYQYGKEGVSFTAFPSDTTVDYGSLPGEARMYRKFSTALTDSRLARDERMRYADTEAEWNEIRARIDSMIEPNPLNGFVFDSANVENEILAVTDVLNSTTAIRCGILGGKSVDEALSEMTSRLKDAGIERIINELNAQLAAFKEKYEL